MKQTASATFHLRRLWSELTFRGLHVPVRGDHISKPVWKGIWRADYEAPELLALSGLMRPAGRVLELGAGMLSTASVMAFERVPDP